VRLLLVPTHRLSGVIGQPTHALFFATGSQLELSEDTVLGVLSACRQELGTLFGYSAENRGVGITGRYIKKKMVP
jgi:hypothetical protein